MIRCFKAKRPVLISVSLIDTHVRKFNLASKSLARNFSHEKQHNEVVKENLENDSNPFIPENSNVNFLGIEGDEGVITVTSKISCLQEKTKTKQLRERFYKTSYGVIRYDTDNKLKFHGQYGKREEIVFPHHSNDVSEVSRNITDMTPTTVDKLSNDYNKSSSINAVKKLGLLYGRTSSEVRKENSSKDNSQFYLENFENVQSKNPLSTNNHSTDELNYLDTEYFGHYIQSENQNLPQGFSENVSLKDKHNLKINSDVTDDAVNNPSLSSSSDDFNFIDKYYFGESNVPESQKMRHAGEISQSAVNKPSLSSSTDDFNFIDKYYFGESNVPESQKLHHAEEISQNTVPFNSPSSESHHQNLSTESVEENKAALFHSNFEEGQKSIPKSNRIKDAFDSAHEMNVSESLDKKQINVKNSDFDFNMKQLDRKILDSNNESNFDSVAKNDLISREKHPLSDKKTKVNRGSNKYSHVVQSDFPKLTKPSQSEKCNTNDSVFSEESTHVDTVTTAYDFVRSLHKQQEVPVQNVKGDGNKLLDMKVDSKGFRILKDQVKDLSHFTRDEILSLLKQSILYQDDNLLILNKPYSLVIHDSQTTKAPCLSSFLEDLAKEIDGKNFNSKLVTVHRLDKETTGCLLIARNETMAQNLQSLFAQRKIIKKYWVLTSKVPDPPEGLIDIPISEGSVNNKRRMVLHPEIPKDIAYRNHSRKGKPALTSYKVLQESGNAALVEATPITGIKHQIRVHFGFGLSCPIIGDHKYSHLDKLAPQKLPSDILQRLHVRQSKVRYVPLHIHAKSVTVPGYFEDRDLYIQAPLPDHMKENLKRLKFKKK